MDIIGDILRREGGDKFTNNPADRGGPTKFGVTQSAWDSYVAKHPDRVGTRLVQGLDEAMAREFYQVEHVAPFAARLRDQALVALLVDCSVNHGRVRAVRWLQSAVGAVVDGKMGPKTAALADATPGAYADVLRTRLRFYARIATDQRDKPGGDPDAWALAGWINRACEFVR
jgi:lysozyme family protein